jgi:hypothetical protein
MEKATPPKNRDAWLYAGVPMTPTGSRGSASKVSPAEWSVSRRLGRTYDSFSESIAVIVDEEVDEEMPGLSDLVDGLPTEDDDMRDASESLANLSIVEFNFHEVASSGQAQGLLDISHSDVDNDNVNVNNAVTDAIFFPGGSGKPTKIRWKEPDAQSILKESKRTRIRNNQKFQIATATAVDSDLSCLEKRLAYWYKSDKKVKEVINNVVSTSATDTPDPDIVVKNLQYFV